MKNLHLLPTEKPSRLGYLTKKGKEVFKDLRLFDKPMPNILDSENQHIYITSDEEIKEDDWGLSKLNEVILFGRSYNEKFYKKIILTTNQDLIANGVQAISDEFLEWFVKNPGCEFVEVDESKYFDGSHGEYIIIIPQEESKYSEDEFEMQSRIINKVWDEEESKQEGYICPHTKIQCDDECCVSAEDCHITSSLASGMVDCKEPKQETLEEAEKEFEKLLNGKALPTKQLTEVAEHYFIVGYEIGQEKRYSEEEVIKLLIDCKDRFGGSDLNDYTTDGEVKRWFEQFKKK
jgi:hypothetical protein